MDLKLPSALTDRTDRPTQTTGQVGTFSVPVDLRVAVVGRGRLGSALAGALRRAGTQTSGPLGRGADTGDCQVVVLCVPDGVIADAAAGIAPGRYVGHCSGATGLDVLSGHEAFSLHPLMTFTASEPGPQDHRFAGAAAAVAGSSDPALALARALASTLGMVPIALAPADRPAYHAAASIASNFLVTLEAAAERVALSAGIDRHMLAPLVRATVENWVALGGAEALTGPVARGDHATVLAQRQAVDERAPELLALFDALVDATGKLAALRERA